MSWQNPQQEEHTAKHMTLWFQTGKQDGILANNMRPRLQEPANAI